MKVLRLVFAALAIGVVSISSAQAHDSFSFGLNIGTPYYAPYQPPVVRYYPTPPVYYYGAPPVYYQAPPPVYYPQASFGYYRGGNGWGHRWHDDDHEERHWRHHDHDDDD